MFEQIISLIVMAILVAAPIWFVRKREAGKIDIKDSGGSRDGSGGAGLRLDRSDPDAR